MGLLIKISHKKAMEICDRYKDSDDLYLITEWGAVGIQEKANYVLELGEKSDDNWFGTIDFLETSEDRCFVRLRKEDYKDKLPNARDLFRVKKIYPNGVIIDRELKN